MNQKSIRMLHAYCLDDQIGYVLRRAYQHACANSIRQMGSYDITPVQYATLARLWEYGEVSQNQLGRLADIEPGNFHGVVQRLLKRGLIEKRKDIGDRRKILLSLTPAGTALIKELIPLSVSGTRHTLSPLTVKQQKQLFELLQLIVDRA